MCWNREISGLFTALQFLIGAYVWYKKRPRYQAYLFITWFFGSMEGLQFLTWYWIEPLSTMQSGAKTCSTGNKIMTWLSYAHVWAQPIAFGVFSQMLSKGAKKSMFVIPIVMSVVTWCISMGALYTGEVYGWRTVDEFPLHHRDHSSCSYEGPNHHILWRFAVSVYDTVPYSIPNTYAYSLMSLSFLWIRPVHVMVFTCFCFWGLSGIAKYMMDFSLESSAYWCFTTISVAFIILLEPLSEYLIGFKEPVDEDEPISQEVIKKAAAKAKALENVVPLSTVKTN
jgi:hypothetical protein